MAEKKWIDLTGLDSGTDSSGKAATKTVEKFSASLDSADADSSQIVKITYKLQGVWDQNDPFGQGGFSLFDLPNAAFSTEPGSPMLVREGLFVAVPSGTVFEKLSIKIVSKTILDGKFDFLPTPIDVVETQDLQFNRNDNIFSSDDLYPKRPVEYIDSSEVMGVRCVNLHVYPFQYRPKSKQVTALTEIDIMVHFRHTGLDSDTGPPKKLRDPRYAEELLGYQDEMDQVDSKSKKRMLIVTTDELASSLLIFRGVKQPIYDVNIVTKEEILSLYPDENEMKAIHKYVMDENDKNQISYLVLGGGIDVIPSPTVISEDPNVGSFPNDNYYSTNSNNPDTYPMPLFCLGRLPVSTAQEMKEVADVASYYNQFFNDKRNTAVFTTCNRYDYEQCSDGIVKIVKNDFAITKCYDGQCSKHELKAAIEKGTGFINYRGHGDTDCWASSNGLSVKDAETLDVGRNTPQVLSIACSNNRIHKKNCFGIAWIKNLKAVSFLGASAPSYTTVNHIFDKFLWEEINKKEFTTIGDIFLNATIRLYKNYKNERCAMTNILEYILLGDPTSDYMECAP